MTYNVTQRLRALAANDRIRAFRAATLTVRTWPVSDRLNQPARLHLSLLRDLQGIVEPNVPAAR